MLTCSLGGSYLRAAPPLSQCISATSSFVADSGIVHTIPREGRGFMECVR